MDDTFVTTRRDRRARKPFAAVPHQPPELAPLGTPHMKTPAQRLHTGSATADEVATMHATSYVALGGGSGVDRDVLPCDDRQRPSPLDASSRVGFVIDLQQLSSPSRDDRVQDGVERNPCHGTPSRGTPNMAGAQATPGNSRKRTPAHANSASPMKWSSAKVPGASAGASVYGTHAAAAAAAAAAHPGASSHKYAVGEHTQEGQVTLLSTPMVVSGAPQLVPYSVTPGAQGHTRLPSAAGDISPALPSPVAALGFGSPVLEAAGPASASAAANSAAGARLAGPGSPWGSASPRSQSPPMTLDIELRFSTGCSPVAAAAAPGSAAGSRGRALTPLSQLRSARKQKQAARRGSGASASAGTPASAAGPSGASCSASPSLSHGRSPVQPPAGAGRSGGVPASKHAALAAQLQQLEDMWQSMSPARARAAGSASEEPGGSTAGRGTAEGAPMQGAAVTPLSGSSSTCGLMRFSAGESVRCSTADAGAAGDGPRGKGVAAGPGAESATPAGPVPAATTAAAGDAPSGAAALQTPGTLKVCFPLSAGFAALTPKGSLGPAVRVRAQGAGAAGGAGSAAPCMAVGVDKAAAGPAGDARPSTVDGGVGKAAAAATGPAAAAGEPAGATGQLVPGAVPAAERVAAGRSLKGRRSAVSAAASQGGSQGSPAKAKPAGSAGAGAGKRQLLYKQHSGGSSSSGGRGAASAAAELPGGADSAGSMPSRSAVALGPKKRPAATLPTAAAAAGPGVAGKPVAGGKSSEVTGGAAAAARRRASIAKTTPGVKARALAAAKAAADAPVAVGAVVGAAEAGARVEELPTSAAKKRCTQPRTGPHAAAAEAEEDAGSQQAPAAPSRPAADPEAGPRAAAAAPAAVRTRAGPRALASRAARGGRGLVPAAAARVYRPVVVSAARGGGTRVSAAAGGDQGLSAVLVPLGQPEKPSAAADSDGVGSLLHEQKRGRESVRGAPAEDPATSSARPAPAMGAGGAAHSWWVPTPRTYVASAAGGRARARTAGMQPVPCALSKPRTLSSRKASSSSAGQRMPAAVPSSGTGSARGGSVVQGSAVGSKTTVTGEPTAAAAAAGARGGATPLSASKGGVAWQVGMDEDVHGQVAEPAAVSRASRLEGAGGSSSGRGGAMAGALDVEALGAKLLRMSMDAANGGASDQQPPRGEGPRGSSSSSRGLADVSQWVAPSPRVSGIIFAFGTQPRSGAPAAAARGSTAAGGEQAGGDQAVVELGPAAEGGAPTRTPGKRQPGQLPGSPARTRQRSSRKAGVWSSEAAGPLCTPPPAKAPSSSSKGGGASLLTLAAANSPAVTGPAGPQAADAGAESAGTTTKLTPGGSASLLDLCSPPPAPRTQAAAAPAAAATPATAPGTPAAAGSDAKDDAADGFYTPQGWAASPGSSQASPSPAAAGGTSITRSGRRYNRGRLASSSSAKTGGREVYYTPQPSTPASAVPPGSSGKQGAQGMAGGRVAEAAAAPSMLPGVESSFTAAELLTEACSGSTRTPAAAAQEEEEPVSCTGQAADSRAQQQLLQGRVLSAAGGVGVNGAPTPSSRGLAAATAAKTATTTPGSTLSLTESCGSPARRQGLQRTASMDSSTVRRSLGSGSAGGSPAKPAAAGGSSKLPVMRFGTAAAAGSGAGSPAASLGSPSARRNLVSGGAGSPAKPAAAVGASKLPVMRFGATAAAATTRSMAGAAAAADGVGGGAASSSAARAVKSRRRSAPAASFKGMGSGAAPSRRSLTPVQEDTAPVKDMLGSGGTQGPSYSASAGKAPVGGLQGSDVPGKHTMDAVAAAVAELREEQLVEQYGFAAMPGVSSSVARRNAAAVAKHMMRRRHSVGAGGGGGRGWDSSTHKAS